MAEGRAYAGGSVCGQEPTSPNFHLEHLLTTIPTEPRARIAAFRAAIAAGQIDAITLLHRTSASSNILFIKPAFRCSMSPWTIS
jgi:hypothetical protein